MELVPDRAALAQPAAQAEPGDMEAARDSVEEVARARAEVGRTAAQVTVPGRAEDGERARAGREEPADGEPGLEVEVERADSREEAREPDLAAARWIFRRSRNPTFKDY